jgi:hypothetical protein
MNPDWTCTNDACDFTESTPFARYCPWCGQDLEPCCDRCGGSLLFQPCYCCFEQAPTSENDAGAGCNLTWE